MALLECQNIIMWLYPYCMGFLSKPHQIMLILMSYIIFIYQYCMGFLSKPTKLCWSWCPILYSYISIAWAFSKPHQIMLILMSYTTVYYIHISVLHGLSLNLTKLCWSWCPILYSYISIAWAFSKPHQTMLILMSYNIIFIYQYCMCFLSKPHQIMLILMSYIIFIYQYCMGFL